MKAQKQSSKSAGVRKNVYTRVTDKIVADLERGVRPWMKPWSGEHAGMRGGFPLRHCGTPYRGINILLLWSEAMERGYASAKWMTFRQAKELGGHVRKGEHGSLVVYADRIHKVEEDERGQEVEREIPFMKGYSVFNADQIEGLPEDYYDRIEPNGEPIQLIEAAETFFDHTGAVFRHGGDRAYYAGGPDIIQLPVPEAFRDAESYAATKAHELTHWTKHPERLGRDLGRKAWGDEGYAREELVAELGAAFLCAGLGVTPEVREDHAAYLDHWLKIIKDDPKAIFSAAAHAQRAVDYLHGLQPGEAR